MRRPFRASRGARRGGVRDRSGGRPRCCGPIGRGREPGTTPEVRVNVDVAMGQTNPDVAATPDGRALIVWEDRLAYPAGWIPTQGIRGAFFDASVSRSGGVIEVDAGCGALVWGCSGGGVNGGFHGHRELYRLHVADPQNALQHRCHGADRRGSPWCDGPALRGPCRCRSAVDGQLRREPHWEHRRPRSGAARWSPATRWWIRGPWKR